MAILTKLSLVLFSTARQAQYLSFKMDFFVPSLGESSSSVLDQLPIAIQESVISEEQIKAVLPKVTLRHGKSKQLKKVLHPKQPIIKRYFTAGLNINDSNIRDLKKEPCPFIYPDDMEAFALKVINKAWRDDIRVKELQQKYYNRPSYKERQKVDLLNRLYVKDPAKELMRTMIDIDPNYYEIIQGRRIPDRLDIRQYIQTVRDSLKTKIITGFREDDIMLIDEALSLEQKIIDVIKENLQQYVDIFEEFLLQDHSSAMKLLSDADDTNKRAYDKYLECNAIAQKFASLSTSLFNLEEKWRLCKTYQKFLYTVSPLSWRMQQEGSTRRASIYVAQQATDAYVVGALRTSILQKGLSLQDILEEFRQETYRHTSPQLYFSNPEELMDVFRFMEMQNLNSLLHSEELALPLETIKDGMKSVVETYDVDIKNLIEMIDSLEGGISWEENRVIYLQELATNLLKNELKDLVTQEEVLNLHVMVEDVYESKLGPNDANISITEMMQAIEEDYRQELLYLDNIPSKQVAVLESTYYDEQLMTMKMAELAAKQFDELERITSNLKKAFEPPKQKSTEKELKKRSPPIKPPKKIHPRPRSLTEQEEEYLEYFTDFCKHRDDPKEYGIDTSPEADGHRMRLPNDFSDEEDTATNK